MKIKERLEKWVFDRDLRLCRKRFEKIRRSSIYNNPPKRERRGLIKELIRAAGYKNIRIKERT
jgi:hypothetical protein